LYPGACLSGPRFEVCSGVKQGSLGSV